MTDRHHQLLDLLSDPICRLLMERDGVRTGEVLRLMRTVRPVIGRGWGGSRDQVRSMAA